ncbi:MAG: DsrE family protein [Bacteroidales bacterium]|nr:DsrE family protein [Bacteroidales bacterium]
MRVGLSIAAVLVILSASLVRSRDTAPTPTPPKTEQSFPLVPAHGGIVPTPGAAEPPRQGTKVIFDITAGGKLDKVNPGFERVARYLNLSAAHGVMPNGIKITAVLHGGATVCALGNTRYAQHAGTKGNPNLSLIRELQKHGVEIYVCGQSLAREGFATDDVTKEVPIAVSAMSVLVNRQTDGYAFLPVN